MFYHQKLVSNIANGYYVIHSKSKQQYTQSDFLNINNTHYQYPIGGSNITTPKKIKQLYFYYNDDVAFLYCLVAFVLSLFDFGSSQKKDKQTLRTQNKTYTYSSTLKVINAADNKTTVDTGPKIAPYKKKKGGFGYGIIVVFLILDGSIF